MVLGLDGLSIPIALLYASVNQMSPCGPACDPDRVGVSQHALCVGLDFRVGLDVSQLPDRAAILREPDIVVAARP